jgi:hypothetical protein
MRTPSVQVRPFFALALLAAAVGACDSSKSENVLSPTVAGPIAGVTISAPTLVTPSSDQRIQAAQQPVTLTIQNASTNGQRPLTYVFEVALDAAFATKVFTRTGVEPGANGKTSVTLAEALETGRSYYWRAQALDGANTGPFATAWKFDIYTAIAFEAPTPLSPADGTTVSTLRPAMVVSNATRTGSPAAVSYTFQVAEVQTFAVLKIEQSVAEQSTQTQFIYADDLLASKTYYWRARASDGTTAGPWSQTQSFKTPAQDSGSGSISGDDIDPSTFDWRNVDILSFNQQDIASWAKTATPGTVYAHNPDILFEADIYADWIERAYFGDKDYGAWGNIWIVFKMNGQIYASTTQWMHGLDGNRSVIREEFRYTFNGEQPPASWDGPQDGQVIGLFVSTRARFEGPPNDVRERSPIVWVRYNTNDVVGIER